MGLKYEKCFLAPHWAKEGKGAVRKLIYSAALCCLSLIVLFSACSKESGDEIGERDNTPKVLTAEAAGKDVYGNDYAIIDSSNSQDGYVMVKYQGSSDKVRLQITCGNKEPYTYVLDGSNEYEVFPFSDGDGSYTVNIFENIEGDRYAQICGTTIDVALVDEFLPFLYPNQYVDFSADSEAVALGAELAASADQDLDVVENIYEYIINNITYDYDRASSVDSGYLPVVDSVLDEGKGICFDYAALAAAMLRSQRIPTRLVIGYSDDVYHAWISVYIEDVGWVNNVIEFKGADWVRMDPTYDANAAAVERYIGSGSNYHEMYLY